MAYKRISPQPVNEGGTGALTLTDHGVLVGSGTAAIDALTVGTTGQLLVGASGADPAFAASATGDFTFTSTTAGATRIFTVSNTDNTNAASTALHQITTGGSSAGDPFTTYTVSGATSWSTGIDNSASDAYVIAASTALGTTNVVSMATGGAVSCVLGNFDVTKSSSGADVSMTASNTSNTATSSATAYLTVAGSTAADARVQYAVSGTTTWTEGIDNSDSDAYVLAASNALGTTNVIHAATSGEINYPLQPAFLAYLGSQDDNVTGDNTTYVLGNTSIGNTLTEVYDQSSDFTPGASGGALFTAPVTGKYNLGLQVKFLSLSASFTVLQVFIVTSNSSYTTVEISGAAVRTSSSTYIVSSTIFTDLDAADTAQFSLRCQGGTKVVDIGAGRDQTAVFGFLVC